MKRRLIIAAVVWMSTSVGAHAAAQEVLTFGYVQFPPFTYTHDGVADGTVIERSKAVSERAGYRLRFVDVSGRRLGDGLRSGEIDIAATLRATAGVDRGHALSGDAVVDRIIVEAYAIGRPPQVTTVKDLAGRRVILNIGYQYGDWRRQIDAADSGVIVTNQVLDATAGLASLKAGRGEILLHYQNHVDEVLHRNPMPDLQRATVQSLPIYFVVSAKRRDAAALVERFDMAFRSLWTD